MKSIFNFAAGALFATGVLTILTWLLVGAAAFAALKATRGTGVPYYIESHESFNDFTEEKEVN